MLGGDGGDGARRLAALERPVDLVQPGAQHEPLGAHASYVVKRVAQGALADTGHPAQILDRNGISPMRVQEGFRLFDHPPAVGGSLRVLGESSVVHEFNAKAGIMDSTARQSTRST